MGMLKQLIMKSNERYKLGDMYFKQARVKDFDKLCEIDRLMHGINYLKKIKSPSEYITSLIIDMESRFGNAVFELLYELLEYKAKKPSRIKFQKIIQDIPIDDITNLVEWCSGFRIKHKGAGNE